MSELEWVEGPEGDAYLADPETGDLFEPVDLDEIEAAEETEELADHLAERQQESGRKFSDSEIDRFAKLAREQGEIPEDGDWQADLSDTEQRQAYMAERLGGPKTYSSKERDAA